jgi:lipopolysaccharide transport system ATP-binding protein
VLFVSHNLGSISQLCAQTIILKNGTLEYKGFSSFAIDHYLLNNSSSVNRICKDSILVEENQFKTFKNVDSSNSEKCEFKFDEEIGLFVELYIPNWNPNLELAVSLQDRYKKRIFTIHEPLIKYYNGVKSIKLHIIMPSLFITPGIYSWISCINFPGNQAYDLQEDISSLTITETGSQFARYKGLDFGCVFAKYEIHQIL